jgi:uncharacterized membrane protein YcaP (DUF421 family)
MEWLHTIIGHPDGTLSWWQMSIRGAILFGFAVALLRIGGGRVFGKNTALDIIISVILGSNISRAITGNSPLVPTIVATIVLFVLHGGLANLACRSDLVSRVAKGRETQLVDDGEILWKAMRSEGIAQGDLEEVMRLNGFEAEIADIRAAYLERNGEISVIMR